MENRKIEVDITGMTCRHCAVSIESLLKNKEGITIASVNHESGKGEITFDGQMTTDEDIISTINSTKKYQARGTSSVLNAPAEPTFYDLIIIGGGSSAFSAAITAHELVYQF